MKMALLYELRISFFCVLVVSLFSFPVVLANNWYVDNSVASSGNGQSWSNAWKGFSNIAWTSIQSGDVIYISGGTVNKIYLEGLTIPSGSNGITLTKGKDPNHNGEVILKGSGSGEGISIQGVNSPTTGITISNITIDNFNTDVSAAADSTSGSLKNIVLDNLKLLNFGRAGLFMECYTGTNVPTYRASCTGNVIKNSYINDRDGFSGQSDGIYVQYMGEFTADNNTIILDNPINVAGADFHSDNAQSFWVDNITYSNNLALQQSSSKAKGTQLLFVEEGNGVHKFINNAVFSNSPNSIDSTLRIKRNAGTFHAIVYGNSVFTRNDQVLSTDDPNSVLENNIFYSQGTGSYHSVNVQFSSRGSGSVVDYNVYYTPNGMIDVSGTMGAHDIVANPLFINVGDYTTANLMVQQSSPAIDHGVALGIPYNRDKTGISRPQGSLWDIGAYETVVGGVSCTPADTNCDNCVSLNEVSSYVSSWLNGDIILSDVSVAVGLWLGGC